MKKILMVIICLIFVLGCIVGCGVLAISKDNTRYELKNKGNKCYLIINENAIKSNINVGMIQEAEIRFDSIEAFVDTVKNGKLNDNQLAIANKVFEKDSTGIKVCDFSNIQVPVHPIEFECKTVFWSGELYSFYLESPNGEIAYFHFLNSEKYNYQYENNYARFFDNDGLLTTKVVNNKNNTEYYYSTTTGDLKKVRYNVTNGKTVLVVDETYRLNMEDNSLMVSNDIPYRVTIYGNNSGKFFSIDIFGIKNKPTVEWLNNFNIKAYK